MSTITTILSTDYPKDSRSVINTNFSNLNTDKVEANSPTLTGIPVAPTAAINTDTTQLATTAFVQAASGYSKNGLSTRDNTTASGTQIITHGLGKIPKMVRLESKFWASGTDFAFSSGSYNGTTNSCSWVSMGGGSGSAGGDTTNIIKIQNQAGTASQVGVVTVNILNIVITWTKTGSTAAGTIYTMWQVQ